ncbi:hypothetical protein BDR07DRAFT_1379027 [Suillus spraguei]|nr:hypothetical protein BDR07DRAFT_1379027 [Suillus spraguei]
MISVTVLNRFADVRIGPNIAALQCRTVLRWEVINKALSEANGHLKLATGTNGRATRSVANIRQWELGDLKLTMELSKFVVCSKFHTPWCMSSSSASSPSSPIGPSGFTMRDGHPELIGTRVDEAVSISVAASLEAEAELLALLCCFQAWCGMTTLFYEMVAWACPLYCIAKSGKREARDFSTRPHFTVLEVEATLQRGFLKQCFGALHFLGCLLILGYGTAGEHSKDVLASWFVTRITRNMRK